MRRASLLDGQLVPAPKESDLERVDCILPTHIFLRHPHNPNRDLKQWRRGRRRQREPQKSTSFKTALNSARALHFFCTFLWRHCTNTMWSFLILRFMEDANTRQRFPFPFSELRYSLLEFNSRKTLPTFSPRASSPIWASEASLVRGRGPSRLRRPLARSRETRFTRPNRRACAQATNIWRTERNGRSAIKIEAVRINFLSDVFVALGVFVAWAPY